MPERINSSLESEGGVVTHTATLKNAFRNVTVRATTPSAPPRRLRDILLMRSHPSFVRRGVCPPANVFKPSSAVAKLLPRYAAENQAGDRMSADNPLTVWTASAAAIKRMRNEN